MARERQASKSTSSLAREDRPRIACDSGTDLDGVWAGGFRFVEECFVESDVFCGCVERPVEALHGVVLSHSAGTTQGEHECEGRITRG